MSNLDWVIETLSTAWRNGGQALFGALCAYAYGQRKHRAKIRHMRTLLYRELGQNYLRLHEALKRFDRNPGSLLSVTLSTVNYDSAKSMDLELFNAIPESNSFDNFYRAAKAIGDEIGFADLTARSMVSFLHEVLYDRVLDQRILMKSLDPETQHNITLPLLQAEYQWVALPWMERMRMRHGRIFAPITYWRTRFGIRRINKNLRDELRRKQLARTGDLKRKPDPDSL